MIFESHAHYDDKAFDADRDELLEAMPEHGIGYILNAGSSFESIQIILDLTERYSFVYGALGIHPSDTKKLDEDKFGWLKEQFGKRGTESAKNKKIVAVGEIGLDYYWDEPDREIQKRWFKRQLELAKNVNLPVIIHSREAAKDTLDTLREHNIAALGGVMHCFSYSQEIARACLEMNLYIGIGGVVTFKNAQKVKDVVAYTPLNKILLETDCPYLAPVPYRGKRNTSAYLPFIINEIAAIKGISFDEVAQETTENARRLFMAYEQALA